jgi:hypothetical protein
MTASLLLEGGESTYNTPNGVVQESGTLAATSQQYWARRQANVQTEIERVQAKSLQTTGKLEWDKFRSTGLSFINRLLWRFFHHLEKPLRAYWNNNKALAKDGVRLYREGVSVELLIPISTEPYRIAHLAKGSEGYSICAEPFLNLGAETTLSSFGRLGSIPPSVRSMWIIHPWEDGMPTPYCNKCSQKPQRHTRPISRRLEPRSFLSMNCSPKVLSCRNTRRHCRPCRVLRTLGMSYTFQIRRKSRYLELSNSSSLGIEPPRKGYC